MPYPCAIGLIFFNTLLADNVRPRLLHTYMYAQPSCRSINFNSTPSKGCYRAVAETINRSVDDMAERDRVLAEVEQDITDLVEAASRGDFARRLQPADGSMARLCNGINDLTATIRSTLAAIDGVLSAISHGDLGRRIEDDFQGVFATIKANTNRMADELARIVAEIGDAADSIDETASGVADGSRALS